MQCADHPYVNEKNGDPVNVKNGIHVFFADIACDRRKLIEIRSEALEMCRCFRGVSNDFDEFFDLGVYKVPSTISSFIILFRKSN